jgi:predicted nucleotidyltransferase
MGKIIVASQTFPFVPEKVTIVTNMITSGADAVSATLLGKTRGSVLGLLLTRPGEAFHVRQVARLTGAGLGPVQRELKLLALIGVLKRQEIGRHVLYSAEPACPVHEELRGLILKTVGVSGQLRQVLAQLEDRIRLAFLFGSFASGTQHPASDVDLLVVGNVPFAALVKALAKLQRRLGREINPSVYSPVEFTDKLQSGHHFLTALKTAPKVFLIGDEHEFSRLAEERLDSRASNQPRRDRRLAERSGPRLERQHRRPS